MVLQGAESSTLSSGMPSVQRGFISRKNSFILVVSHLAGSRESETSWTWGFLWNAQWACIFICALTPSELIVCLSFLFCLFLLPALCSFTFLIQAVVWHDYYCNQHIRRAMATKINTKLQRINQQLQFQISLCLNISTWLFLIIYLKHLKECNSFNIKTDA